MVYNRIKESVSFLLLLCVVMGASYGIYVVLRKSCQAIHIIESTEILEIKKNIDLASTFLKEGNFLATISLCQELLVKVPSKNPELRPLIKYLLGFAYISAAQNKETYQRGYTYLEEILEDKYCDLSVINKARFILANSLIDEDLGINNEEKATAFFKEILESKHNNNDLLIITETRYMLALRYLNQDNEIADKTAFELLKQALADDHFIDATSRNHTRYLLATIYYYGCQENEPDYKKAREMIETILNDPSADDKFTDPARCFLADIYFFGRECEKDHIKAKNLLLLVNQGNVNQKFWEISQELLNWITNKEFLSAMHLSEQRAYESYAKWRKN